MKKVAIVVLNDFQNDSRVLKIARSLGRNQFATSVVAMKKGQVLERESFHEFEAHRMKLKTMSLPRIFNVFKFIEWAWKVARTYRQFDFFHCCDFEALPVGLLAKKFNSNLKIVYDAHEYEKERLGLSNIQKKLIGFFEKRWIGKTDAVITVSKGIEKEYEKLFEDLPLHEVIFNAPAYRKTEKHQNDLRGKLNLRADQKVFLYSGRLAQGRGVPKLIETFSNRGDDQAVLVFLGRGPLLQMVLDSAEKHENIIHLPPVPYDEVVATVAQADFGMLSTENNCLNNYFCMPNKLFEYIQAGLPILVANLKDCQSLIEEQNIGFASDDDSAKGWNKLVDQALQSSPNEFSEALSRVAEEYNWENEEKKLLKLYEQVEEGDRRQ